MVIDTLTGDVVLLVGRLLFGGVLAFTGLNHFMDADNMAEYADAKGVPAPKLAVLGSGAMLVAGGLSLVVGAYPGVGALLMVVFFVGVTPKMHDFWNVDDPEQRQNEMTHFLKNVAMLGGALAFLALAGEAWGYSAGVGLLW
ncbi:MAG: DoxX family protein [Halobacteriales archaeon]